MDYLLDPAEYDDEDTEEDVDFDPDGDYYDEDELAANASSAWENSRDFY